MTCTYEVRPATSLNGALQFLLRSLALARVMYQKQRERESEHMRETSKHCTIVSFYRRQWSCCVAFALSLLLSVHISVSRLAFCLLSLLLYDFMRFR
jgi:hypothetical protein